jgi:hypothetical protein
MFRLTPEISGCAGSRDYRGECQQSPDDSG